LTALHRVYEVNAFNKWHISSSLTFSLSHILINKGLRRVGKGFRRVGKGLRRVGKGWEGVEKGRKGVEKG
jgi:hypothetical protein